ncbi:MAG: hypothetical protein E7614_02235 [Ruminococcaceae bacterium]|nr:hypothetical protein [Oscillospiraceae bacterium]
MTFLNKNKRTLFLLLALILLLASCNGNEGSFESEYVSEESVESEASEEEISFEAPDQSLADNGFIDLSFVANEGGYVSGSLKQVLEQGELSKTVTAIPNLCYRFKEWSDGVTEATRSGESFSEDTVLTAVFEYSGLPEIHIEYKKWINKRYPISASFTVKNASGIYEFESATGQIQGRGNSTWNHAKKPYKIKFDEKVNLLGIGSNAKKDWVLLANHGDQSLFRNYLAYNIAHKAGIGYKATLVEVYLNGKYNGVYMLTGKVEESRLGVDATKEKGGFIIELDDYYSGKENVDYLKVGAEYYSLKSDYIDSEHMKTIKQCIIDINSAIATKDKDQICALIDIDSCIDMYLLQEYTKNTDVGWSSFYMYKRDEGDKLRFGPAWDFDIAMGNDYRLDKGSYENIYVGRYSGFTQQNWWFIYLCRMEWFRELALERWNTVFYGYVEDTLDELKDYAEINWEELENNFVRWNIFGKRVNCEPTQIINLRSYLEHYRYFIAWTELRLEWLDNCYNDIDFWMKEINDRTYPQYKGGKIPEIEPDPNAPEKSEEPESSEESEDVGDYAEMPVTFENETKRKPKKKPL